MRSHTTVCVMPNRPLAEPRHLLTVADVAAQLQVSQKTVRRAIERGDLAIHRIGRQIRISATDLDIYVRLRRVASSSTVSGNVQ